MRVIKVDHGRTVFRQRIKEAALFFGDPRERPHTRQMCTLCIGDDSDRRLRQLRQCGNLARMTHAQLNHRIAMLRTET